VQGAAGTLVSRRCRHVNFRDRAVSSAPRIDGARSQRLGTCSGPSALLIVAEGDGLGQEVAPLTKPRTAYVISLVVALAVSTGCAAGWYDAGFMLGVACAFSGAGRAHAAAPRIRPCRGRARSPLVTGARRKGVCC